MFAASVIIKSAELSGVALVGSPLCRYSYHEGCRGLSMTREIEPIWIVKVTYEVDGRVSEDYKWFRHGPTSDDYKLLEKQGYTVVGTGKVIITEGRDSGT